MNTLLGKFDIIPRDVLKIIVSKNHHSFWCLNKYFRELSCRLLRPDVQFRVLYNASGSGALDLVNYILSEDKISIIDVNNAINNAYNNDQKRIVETLLQVPMDKLDAKYDSLKSIMLGHDIIHSSISFLQIEYLEMLFHSGHLDPVANNYKLLLRMYKSFTSLLRIHYYTLDRNLELHKEEYENITRYFNLLMEIVQDVRVNPDHHMIKFVVRCLHSVQPVVKTIEDRLNVCEEESDDIISSKKSRKLDK